MKWKMRKQSHVETSIGRPAVLNPLMLVLEQLDLALELPSPIPLQVLQARAFFRWCRHFRWLWYRRLRFWDAF